MTFDPDLFLAAGMYTLGVLAGIVVGLLIAAGPRRPDPLGGQEFWAIRAWELAHGRELVGDELHEFCHGWRETKESVRA